MVLMAIMSNKMFNKTIFIEMFWVKAGFWTGSWNGQIQMFVSIWCWVSFSSTDVTRKWVSKLIIWHNQNFPVIYASQHFHSYSLNAASRRTDSFNILLVDFKKNHSLTNTTAKRSAADKEDANVLRPAKPLSLPPLSYCFRHDC